MAINDSTIPLSSSSNLGKELVRSGIQNYFRPVPRSSSPSTSRSILVPPASIEHQNAVSPLSPPSTSPLRTSPLISRNFRQPRRLTTRHSLPDISSVDCRVAYHDCDFSAPPSMRAYGPQGKSLVKMAAELLSVKTRGSKKSSSPATTTIKPKETSALTPSKAVQEISQHSCHDFASPPPRLASIDIPSKGKKVRSIQTTLSLGQSSSCVSCKDCGMIYDSIVKEDVSEHQRSCSVGRMPPFRDAEKQLTSEIVWEKLLRGQKTCIRVITALSEDSSKATALRIIRYTHDKMGGDVNEYDASELWARFINDETGGSDLRFKLFVYYISSRAVGVLLAERYREGMPIAIGAPGDKKEVIIDRIYVENEYMRRGIASELADMVRREFLPGRTLQRKEVTTSQLTASGMQWAFKYFT
ncbi:hypothetical protein BJ875DRAFT_169633 [Amylocarpus encephaloides]|uniref:N-acetyltransferase domain-containing protein n=1 Tax=Amylocarpus encephaloides TaxID=45428 RepID=A0A9P7YBI1_9HELO|nr:hypothetical protein BJ875DRAFT_169633 [Amylocarpus encephaloides]